MEDVITLDRYTDGETRSLYNIHVCMGEYSENYM